jgi:hypothetical protein
LCLQVTAGHYPHEPDAPSEWETRNDTVNGERLVKRF